ncbi:aminotransferase class I/II-fold pyridoxal phosphate-dependent enzyme [Bacillus sp. HMF5848]|uniref:aminotransferase class I/II-fold pyridoxal phosphate-dependent enzyme n=1 Tax=Bacillus sp. HMF5848 TaxID=2495421 RepID=UPI000F77E9D9|nr:aminotransferase class I/II-fold pyridoxal phosphate-dependent enzyme [Bacillus sp. HMF5848]RSK25461.1 aminotransferase class I/II-fold pyridoxal phosphate-dependent enzyme [Bacillus sp. HMF5848]
MNHMDTPLYNALLEHIHKSPISFHVPGHKNGVVMANDNSDFRNLYKYDVTELAGLDDLHAPTGCIAKAESLASDYYGSEKTFFLVNGSTVGNLAMILAHCNENDTVLVQRNCHKSVFHGLQLAGVDPVYVAPEYDKSMKVSGAVTLETMKEAVTVYPYAKAVILTYPNYYGMAYDIKSIIELAHSHDMLVLIDEAHGAHFALGGPFPPSAITLGADVVVQSAHKTLPAMTMGSFLHIKGNRASQKAIKTYLHMLQSSSPSYPIMASLDLARFYIASIHRDKEKFHKIVTMIEAFKENIINEIPEIKIATAHSEDYKQDILKLVLQSGNGLSGYDLQSRLQSVGIFVEMADFYNVVLVLPLSDSYEYTHILSRMKKALKAEIHEMRDVTKAPIEQAVKIPKVSKPKLTFKELSMLETEHLHMKNAVGRMCAEAIIPYPPGIPIITLGETFTIDHVLLIEHLIQNGGNFQNESIVQANVVQVYKEKTK